MELALYGRTRPHPIPEGGPMSNFGDSIVPLDQLDDFEIAEGDPDVRGWTVISADGREIGEVDEVLIDTSVMKVRYLDVAITRDLLTDSEERHVLIPIGYARLDDDDDQIFVDGLSSERLRQIPAYRQETLSPDYDESVRGYFDSSLERSRRADAGEGPDFVI